MIETHAKMKEKRSGHERCGRILAIAVVVVMAAIVFGPASRNVAATTTVTGWTGYYGNNNEVIYMTTGTSTLTPYIMPTVYGTGVQSSTSTTISNAVNLTVGRDVSTTLQNLIPHYFYDGAGQVLRIYLPVAVASGSSVAKDVFGSGSVVMAFWQNESVKGFTGTGQIVDTDYNSGINATWGSTYGKGNINASQLLGLFKLTWDGMSMLPGLGFPIGSYTLMQDYEALVGVDSAKTEPIEANSVPAFETFDITMPTYACGPYNAYTCVGNQQVYAPQTYLELTIPSSQFLTPSSFLVTASNSLGWWNPSNGQISPLSSCSGCLSPQGASASISIPTVPAVTLTGTVSLGGNALANQPITLQETYNGATTNYQLTTNSSGAYRFFARLGTSYILSTTYGPTTWQTTSLTTPNSATAATLSLNIPALSVSAFASPMNTQPGVSVQFQATLSGGVLYPVSFSWTFGDGTTGAGSAPTHVYTASGTYYASVTVVDSSNPAQTATLNPPIKIAVANPCSGTSACISPSSQTVYYGVCNIPTASFSGFPATTDVGPFTYSWNFGDGKTGTGQTVSHTYPAVAKTYTVTLTITDGTGIKSTATATVTVKYMAACSPSP